MLELNNQITNQQTQYQVETGQKEQIVVDQLQKIDQWHVEQFARFLGKLRGITEGDRTLLDNCMIMYGSGLSDGNKHWHHDLPVVVAGRGGRTLKTGHHILAKDEKRAWRKRPTLNIS